MCFWTSLLVEGAAGRVPVILLVPSHCRGVLGLLVLLLLPVVVVLLLLLLPLLVVVVAQEWLGLVKAASWRGPWSMAGAVEPSSLAPPLAASPTMAAAEGAAGPGPAL